MSNTRKQLEEWLQTLEIKGTVLDVGGSAIPVKGRTKTWDVSYYDILDHRAGEGIIVRDLNEPIDFPKQYDNVFCLEVMEYVYDPRTATQNLAWFVKKGGKLYLSTHFIFPHHSGGVDCLRYTRNGITKLLTRAGLKVLSITPRMAVDGTLATALDKESKRQYYRGEIGHLIIAEKC